MKAQMTLLGSGMSHGVPVIGCECETCKSSDSHDNRLRTSAILQSEKTTILFDCGADFRIQAVRNKIKSIDAAIISHIHADHIFGIDDLRAYSLKKEMPIYSSKVALDDIYQHFDYIFKVTQIGGGKPNLDLREIQDQQFQVNEFTITPIPLSHDYPKTLGFRIGNTAYLTDMYEMEESSYEKLKGVEQVIIDAVRPGKLKNHLSFEGAIEVIGRIHPKRAFFIHIDHTMKHKDIQKFIDDYISNKPNLKDIIIQPGYDGLVIDVLC